MRVCGPALVALCDDEGMSEVRHDSAPDGDSGDRAPREDRPDDPGEAGTGAPSYVIDPVTGRVYPTRSRVFLTGLRSTATVCLQLILVAVFLWLIGWLIGEFWVIVLPVVLAIVVATVLWPMVRWLRSKGMPAALASLVVMLAGIAVVAGVFSLIIPSVIEQAPVLAAQTVEGVRQLEDWIKGPPLNVDDEQLNGAVNAIVERVQDSGDAIAAGVLSGVGTATSVLITLFTTVVLVFFFLKDGPRLLPWVNRTLGQPSAQHTGELLTRMWSTLGGFIRTQAIVSAVDAVLIGAGLFFLNVPLWGVLTIFTFVGGFVPIVGAFVAGALAVLIALVANGPTTALAVLGIILVVQQLEGNVLSPWLQAKSMNLHAAIVLLSVTLGGTLFGIVGAFLAVPVASCLAVAGRYMLETISHAAGEQVAAEDAAAEAAATEHKRGRFKRRRDHDAANDQPAAESGEG